MQHPECLEQQRTLPRIFVAPRGTPMASRAGRTGLGHSSGAAPQRPVLPCAPVPPPCTHLQVVHKGRNDNVLPAGRNKQAGHALSGVLCQPYRHVGPQPPHLLTPGPNAHQLTQTPQRKATFRAPFQALDHRMCSSVLRTQPEASLAPPVPLTPKPKGSISPGARVLCLHKTHLPSACRSVMSGVA